MSFFRRYVDDFETRRRNDVAFRPRNGMSYHEDVPNLQTPDEDPGENGATRHYYRYHYWHHGNRAISVERLPEVIAIFDDGCVVSFDTVAVVRTKPAEH